MTHLLHKLRGHFRRLRNARRFGVRFERRSTFCMPRRVLLPGGFVNLSLPEENGARTDFLMCLLDDGYGLAEIREQPSTILDIGANIGFFALAARNFFPEAIIHCYEPNPSIAPHLIQNASAAGAQVFYEAVGASAGTVFLEEMGDSNQARTSGAKSGVTVPQVSLATAVGRFKEPIELAKIDCEGAEWEMFESPEPWHQIRQIRMEYHLGRTKCYEEVNARLSALGFRVFQHYPAERWGTIWAKKDD